MKKEFIHKVMHDRIVDTRRYRYIYGHDNFSEFILRKPIEYKDLTYDCCVTVWESQILGMLNTQIN